MENFENYFEKNWKLFREFSKIIPDSIEKYFGKIFLNYKILRNSFLMTYLKNFINLRKNFLGSFVR